MKANELRIGNLITRKNKVLKVCIIQPDKILVSGYSWGKYFKCDDLEPIPLTEEWLFKFGFKKYEITGSYIKTPKDTANGFGFRFHTQHPFMEDLFNSVVECSYMEQQLYVKNGLKYVHQLQNIYFALTGEELVERP